MTARAGRGRAPRTADDRGAGSVLVVALVLVVVVGSLLVGSVVQAVVVRHQAATAADLGALAAADLLARGDPGACGAAAEVVAASGAQLVLCRPDADGSVVVQASRGLGGVLSVLGPARVSARAGPAPGPPG